MRKKKTSAKLEKFSAEKRRSEVYSPGTDVSISGLREAITEALFDADIETFRGCIAILLEFYDYRDIVKSTGLSKSTLYRMCEPDSNPTLENFCKVLRFIRSVETSNAA